MDKISGNSGSAQPSSVAGTVLDSVGFKPFIGIYSLQIFDGTEAVQPSCFVEQLGLGGRLASGLLLSVVEVLILFPDPI